MSVWQKNMNICTARYPENELGGLMICGINWGSDPESPATEEDASFFSDSRVNKYPYRNRLSEWFKSWGHEFVTEIGSEGPFERSIAQTNWLPDQSISLKGRNVIKEAKENPDNFLRHLEALRPRLLILCGASSLMPALNSPDCLRCVEKVLGAAARPYLPPLQHDVMQENGRKARRFRVFIQKFEQCDVLGLPHPTGSRGLSNLYMQQFSKEIDPLIKKFKSNLHSQNLSAS